MIFVKATTYVINPEKMKPFLDYIYVFSKKTRMLEMNLSFEYGIQNDDKVILVERWSSQEEYGKFTANPDFKKELETLNKMSKKVITLYEFQTIK
ncbi:putative quinol monooxygenase [Mycoplasma buteonis]|uniref:putative quinol monooxygenase n=1 Tax=Mycoplasma buteonis TaxID=171280 RepID=UPI0005685539|nr:antibiotic biosynthesis monooxygenase [Mycoplasma buteonis]